MMIPSRTKRQFEPEVGSDDEEQQHFDEEDRDNALDLLINMFPDCEPRYIESRISWHMNSFDVVNLVSDELILRQYPLLKNALAREREALWKIKLEKLDFSAPEFLRHYRYPDAQFENSKSPVSNEYKAHSVLAIRNGFRRLKGNFISSILRQNGFHYLPSFRHLKGVYSTIKHSVGDIRRRKRNRRLQQLPMKPCELFYHERWFTHNEHVIYDYKIDHSSRLLDATVRGTSVTCETCMSYALTDDLVACREGHRFCRDCVTSAAEYAVESGKSQVVCLDSKCRNEFPTWLIDTLLPPRLCVILDNRRVEQEVTKFANDIDDLVTCPFCPYATVMPNANDKVFHCLNPGCLRLSCRLCREPDHVPLRCDEVETSLETKMRVYIERAMTEAMIRQCPTCHSRFYKIEGCNHMTCRCGEQMCYVCRKTMKSWEEHWHCSRSMDMDELHRDEMTQAAEAARSEFIRLHPQCVNLNLRYDPSKHLDAW